MANKKQATAKKSFSSEAKTEAVQLITQEGYTLKQAAEKMGCSVASLQNWKKAADAGGGKTSVKATKKRKARKKGKKTAKKAVIMAPVQKSSITFDEFAQNYWSEYSGAADVLRLPPDIAPKAVEYVNNVLRYAYDQFCEQ